MKSLLYYTLFALMGATIFAQTALTTPEAIDEYANGINQEITREELYITETEFNTRKQPFPGVGKYHGTVSFFWQQFAATDTPKLRTVRINYTVSGINWVKRFVFDDNGALIRYTQMQKENGIAQTYYLNQTRLIHLTDGPNIKDGDFTDIEREKAEWYVEQAMRLRVAFDAFSDLPFE